MEIFIIRIEGKDVAPGTLWFSCFERMVEWSRNSYQAFRIIKINRGAIEVREERFL